MTLATVVLDQRRSRRCSDRRAQALSPFVALLVAFAAAPLIAWATGGKYYLARKPKRSWQNVRIDPVLHLRAQLRARGHGVVPGLCRADLLAVLLARRALP